MIRQFFYIFIISLILSSCANQSLIQDTIETNNLKKVKGVQIAVIADNQFHIPDGREYYFENLFVDSKVEVSVRPPHSILFGPFVFNGLINNLQSDIIIHLGDAADVSCSQEFDTFLEIFDSSSIPWLFTPGNHDGYFTGNSQHKSSNKKPWDSTCNGKRLSKAGTVKKYLAKRFNVSTISDKPEDFTINNTYKVTVYAQADNEQPQRSFVLQKIRIQDKNSNKYTSIILFDTANYKRPPKYITGALFPGVKVAGITGELTTKQKNMAITWVDSAVKKGDVVILMGHHPLKISEDKDREGLRSKDSKWIKKIVSDKNNKAIYISAHTHKGGMRKIGESYEFNIPSLVDWPIGMRYLNVNKDEITTSEVLFEKEVLPSFVKESCSKHTEWKTQDKLFTPTAYKDLNRTGMTGKYMHHYLLLSELVLLRDAIRTNNKNSSTKISIEHYLSDLDKKIAKKIKFKQRSTVKSKKEIIGLQSDIRKALTVYSELLFTLSSNDKMDADSYNWCQYWWAAKEDFMYINNINEHEVLPRLLGRAWEDKAIQTIGF